jgi:hypothetical protein
LLSIRGGAANRQVSEDSGAASRRWLAACAALETLKSRPLIQNRMIA